MAELVTVGYSPDMSPRHGEHDHCRL